MADADMKVGVVGIGYVGLPVAIAFARRYPTVAFDVDSERIAELTAGTDRTNEVSTGELKSSGIRFTADEDDLNDVDFFIVAVPTPIDEHRRPDLGMLTSATHTVGKHMRHGAIVVYESTVYPGVTEGICVPILEQESGMTLGAGFSVGYSPERINPGDRQHRFEHIAKVVSAGDAATLDAVAEMYGSVIDAPIHRAPSIAVAEAAKVIENTQRDLNIALVNELSVIFDRLDIDTKAVLEAASTKWNFIPFSPGLVGGHCVGVDPYYLTARAQEVGIQPRVILAGRDANNGMGTFVAHKTLELLDSDPDATTARHRVLVVGFAFKENVPDFRNTGVASVVEHLIGDGADVTVWDPLCDPTAVRQTYGIEISEPGDPSTYDAILLAVPHDDAVDAVRAWIDEHPPRVLVDLKGVIHDVNLSPSVRYWRL